MFLRSNLRDYGMGNKKDDYAMRYFLRERGGAIQGVGAIANTGGLMMQASEGLAEIAAFMREVLPDETEHPMILGDTAQVKIMREAFGLTDAPTKMDEVEPLFALNLDNLIMPLTNGAVLRKPEDADVPLLLEWGYDYLIETGLREAGEEAMESVKEDVARRLKGRKLRLLIHNRKPVAQTGFNSVLPDAVQIGGVYTPPNLRRNGYGRLAVALHLAEVKAQGVKDAILFSANELASQAYRGIGFKQIGTFTLTIFAKDT